MFAANEEPDRVKSAFIDPCARRSILGELIARIKVLIRAAQMRRIPC
jgi:hypothetical protein